MKQQLIPGQLYQWLPQMMKGKDGRLYDVYTMFASGRGWAAKSYYTPKDRKDQTKVIVRALHTNIYREHNKNIVGVDIVKGHGLEILTFNKNPYVRKGDGTFNVTRDDGKAWGLKQFGTLGGQYGVSRTEKYLWDKKDGTPWVDQFYAPDVQAGFLVKDKMHYITNILYTNGNLIKV